MPALVRRLAREYVQRTPGLAPSAVGLVVGRWAARLSAHLVRGNAMVLEAVVPSPPLKDASVASRAGDLPSCCPEGDSVYELLVQR